MILLVQRGKASHAALDMICAGGNVSGKVVQVQIHHIRRKLPEGVQIVNELGWGYRIEGA